MTREEAIECLSERVSIGKTCEQSCMVGFGVNIDTLDEAFDIAISSLRQQDVADKDVGKNEPLTNAQKIRAMTDDELNELFHEIYNAGAEDAVAYEWGQRTNSFEWTMEWLQMPAEEDGHE